MIERFSILPKSFQHFHEHIDYFNQFPLNHFSTFNHSFSALQLSLSPIITWKRFIHNFHSHIFPNLISFINNTHIIKVHDERKMYCKYSSHQRNKTIFFPHNEVIKVNRPDNTIQYFSITIYTCDFSRTNLFLLDFPSYQMFKFLITLLYFDPFFQWIA